MRNAIRSITMALAMLALAAPATFADCGKDHGTQETRAAAMKAESPCAKAMAARAEMKKVRTQGDANLERMLAEMNDATGDRKVELMAEIINELIEQRSQMHRMMDDSEPAMMHHMATHARGGSESDFECPMMKKMRQSGQEDEKTSDWGG